MTADIRDIREKQPHTAGEAQCLHCDHRWVAVAEVGVHELECPQCGLMKGVWSGLISPADGFWECGCGSMAFAIGRDYKPHCLKCGLTPEF